MKPLDKEHIRLKSPTGHLVRLLDIDIRTFTPFHRVALEGVYRRIGLAGLWRLRNTIFTECLENELNGGDQ